MSKDGSKESLDIVIVGGSLGGLCAGVALKSHGHNVTICERNPSKVLYDQGAGVVAGGDTQKFFDMYDRLQEDMSCHSQKRLYLDRSGAIVHEEANQQRMTSWDNVYYRLRANFDGVASAYCSVPAANPKDGATRYAYDHTVTGFEERGDNVEVRYKRTGDGSEGTLTADLLIGSDGPSSTVRKMLLPDVQRSLVGYCALRGTVPESEGSDAAKAAFQERFTFFHADGIQILAYLIPGANGNITPGHRLMNFVWYKNFPLGSHEFKELMTDKHGEWHRYTLPPGAMRPEFWEKMKVFARDNMPPQFAELVEKTKTPFAQAITDVIAPSNDFLGGKVLLMGDALSGFRPHTVASTSQAAFDAMMIADWVSGKQTRVQMIREIMPFARLIQARGVEMGNRSQFGKNVPLEKHIEDRNRASIPHEKLEFPDWVFEGLPTEA